MIRLSPFMKNAASEKGNVLTVLLGAVALTGLLGTVVYNLLSGPFSTMARINLTATSQTDMMAASRIIIMQAVTGSNGGDCDSDGQIEPIAWRTTAGGKPVNGGLIPTTIGAPTTDPWGTEYGYCVWDTGSASDAAGCGGPSAARLDGDNDSSTGTATSGNPASDDQTVIALVSAGPNRSFESTCSAYNTNDATNTTLVTKGGDDIVLKYTYSEAAKATSAIWNLKTSDASTATTAKKLEVGSGISIDTTTGYGNFLALSIAGKAVNSGETQLGNPATCTASDDGLIRYNTTSNFVEVCDGTSSTWVSAGSGSGTPAASCTDDLVGYWSFNEASGYSSIDGSCYGSDAYVTGGSAVVLGQVGNARSLDGTDDIIQVANNSGLDNVGSNLTIAFWVRVSHAAGNGWIINKPWAPGNPSPWHQYGVGWDTGSNSILFTYSDSSENNIYPSIPIAVPNNAWAHVAFTYDGTNARSYLNGVLTATDPSTGTIPARGMPLHIGAFDMTGYSIFAGSVDEVRIYKRALAASEINALYVGLPNPPGDITTNLVGHWKLDETSGTTAADSAGANSMTLANGPTWNTGGLSGGALSFDGTNDLAQKTSASGLPGANAPQTLAAWFRYSSAQTGSSKLFGTYNAASNSGIQIGFSCCTGSINVEKWGGAMLNSVSTVPSANQWHHLAYTWDGTTNILYLDGIQVNSTTTTHQTAIPNSAQIGVNFGGVSYFNGLIDDVRMYNRALTANDVMTLFSQGLGNSQGGGTTSGDYTSNLLGHWKLDENTGPTVYDSGSGGNNLTVFSEPPQFLSSGGYSNGAVNFTTSAQQLTKTPMSSAFFNLLNVTTSAWVYLTAYNTAGNDSYILDFGTPDSGWYMFLNDIGRLNFGAGYSTSGMQRISSTTVPLNTWTHVAAAWDGSNLATGVRLYINGAEVAGYDTGGSTNGSGTRGNDSTNGFVIGPCCGANFALYGKIDDARVYNRTLSAADIAALYASYTTGVTPPPQTTPTTAAGGGYWLNSGYDDIYYFPASATDSSIVIGDLASTDTFSSFYINGAGRSVAFRSFDTACGASCGADMYLRRSRGTLGAPTSVASGNRLGGLQWGGYGGSVVNTHAAIRTDASAAPGTNVVQSKMKFFLDDYGGIDSSPFVIDSSKNFMIGYGRNTSATTTNNTEPFDIYGQSPLVMLENYYAYDTNVNHGATTQIRRMKSNTAGDFTSDLVGWWSFNEGSGTVAADKSGNGLNGTVYGSPTWGNGALPARTGTGIDFDGVNDCVLMPYSSKLEMQPNDSLTLAAWVKAPAGNFTALWSDNTINNNYYFGASSNSFIFSYTDAATDNYYMTTNSDFTANTWQHVVVTYTNGRRDSAQFYINGVAVPTGGWYFGDGSSLAVPEGRPFSVGCANDNGMPPNWYSAVSVDDVRVYKRALSAQDVLALYNSYQSGQLTNNDIVGQVNWTGYDGNSYENTARVEGRVAYTTGASPSYGGPTDSMLGWWKMDDSTAGTTAADSSGNGNTANIVTTGCAAPYSSLSASGKIGGALRANSQDGTNAYCDSLRVTTNSGLNNTAAKTIAAWVYPTGQDSENFILNKIDGGSSNGFFLRVVNYTGIEFLQGGFYDYYWPAVLTTNTWAHVALVWAGTVGSPPQLYVNGTLMTPTTTTSYGGTTINDSAQNLFIGQHSDYPSTTGDAGYIDDVRFYNRTLSVAEIQQIYYSGAGIGASTATSLPTDLIFYTGTQTSNIAERMRITSQGKVGIKTATPATTLDVDGILYGRMSSETPGYQTVAGKRVTIHSRGFSGGECTAINPGCNDGTSAGDFLAFGQDADPGSGIQVLNLGWSQTGVYGGPIIGESNRSGNGCSSRYIGANNNCTSDNKSAAIGFMNDVGGSTTTDARNAIGTFNDIGGSGTGAGAIGYGMTVTGNYSWGIGLNGRNGDTTTGLAGHWMFDETSGTSAADSSGNGNNGTLTNSPTWSASGFVNRSLDFDGPNGTGDYVDLGSPATLDDLPALSISAWIRPDTSTSGTIIQKTSGSTAGWSFYRNAGIAFTMGYSTTQLYAESSSSAPNGQWTHVAVTWDGTATGTNTRIYINGVESSYTTRSSGSGTRGSDAALNGYIGSGAGWSPFDGLIDDVRVYNRVLSAADIVALSNAQAPRYTVSQANTLAIMGGRVGIAKLDPAYTLDVTGTAGLSTGTAWTNISDRRLKDIIGDYEYGLDDIMKLHTVRFRYKKDNPLALPSDRPMIGFIAQEVQDIFPEAVTTRPDGYLDFDIHPISVAMINAAQDLKKRNDAARVANDDLKAENAALERHISAARQNIDKIHAAMKDRLHPALGLTVPLAVFALAGGLFWLGRGRRKS